jgi:hypothetical protein
LFVLLNILDGIALPVVHIDNTLLAPFNPVTAVLFHAAWVQVPAVVIAATVAFPAVFGFAFDWSSMSMRASLDDCVPMFVVVVAGV